MRKIKEKLRKKISLEKNLQGSLKEKLAGTILLCAIVPLAVCGYVFIVIVGIFISTARVRQGVRALDHFVNATLFI